MNDPPPQVPDLEGLRKMSEKDLIESYNQALGAYTASEPDFWLRALERRDAREHRDAIRHLTWAIVAMTAVMTVATLVNVYLIYSSG